MEHPAAYIPMDRLLALARGEPLPDRAHGAALFADISGFTPLTEALVRELGPQRGAEELSRCLNLVYDALITELHSYGGSVISFSGDAVTCWFDEQRLQVANDPLQADADRNLQSGAVPRAVACALRMQRAMATFASLRTPAGHELALAMKIAIASGPVHRFLVGDPAIQLIDAMAGAVLEDMVAAEHQARKGEVVLAPGAAAALGAALQVGAWRADAESGQQFAVVAGLNCEVPPMPWPAIDPGALADEQVRPWLLPTIYQRLRSGQGEFLAELRPAAPLFLRFSGIDYDDDPDAGARLDAFIRQVQGVLARYEGTLLQLTIGDKGSSLYAAFGAPLAHEDDAARAVAAALELRNPGLPFITGVQIGISQGRTRAGAYGGAMRRTYGVLGDEVNLAARLMQAAAPGQILASKVVHQAAAALFTWDQLGDIRVKGKSAPVAIYSPAGPKTRRAATFQEARYALPMVGRAHELAIIEERIAQALAGHGQIIGVTAEAGLGKSRLIAEVISRANQRAFGGFGGECESYGANTSYLVWHSIWQAFFGLDPTDTMETQLAKIAGHLAGINPDLVERLPLLGAALNLPIPDNDLTRSFDARLRKTSLEALLIDCLRAGTTARPGATRAPLLFVLEDCHWIDPLSHELLLALGRAIVDLPVLMVLAYRPPGAAQDYASFPGRRITSLPHFSEIRLAEFSDAEARQLIDLKLAQVYGADGAAPPSLVERITNRAEGNPFYVEELLNYLSDRGIDPHDYAAIAQLDLPSSLHSLILSRIDQLSESQKITLKVASVIGRIFKAAMLWGVYPQLGDAHHVTADLEILSRLELTRQDAEPELAYFFKHILTQEVAYESLPYATRAMLHEQIGQYIEHTYGTALDQVVDLLAHHYSRSENTAKQREWLLRAGEAAQADYANTAALDYYRRVLPLLDAAERVPVMLRLGQVLELVGQWGEAGDLYQQAVDQALEQGNRQAEARCELAMGELLRKQGRYAEATAWLDLAHHIFADLGDQAGLAQVLHYSGTLADQQGDYRTARARYEASLAIRRGLADGPRIASLLNNMAIVARRQGDNATARALHEEALAIRRAVGDPLAIAHSLNNLGNVALDLGDLATAHARLEEAVALRRKVGDRWAVANSLNNLGNVVRAQGDYAAARALYAESLAINHELADRWALAYLLEDIGALAALESQVERALRLVGAASSLREAIGAPLSAAEQARLDQLLAPARASLSAAAQETAIAAGRAMALERAVGYALDDPT